MDGASHKGWLLFLLCLKTRVPPPPPHTQKTKKSSVELPRQQKKKFAIYWLSYN